MKKKISGLLAALLLLIQLSVSMVAQAADGKLSLALSSSSVQAGETVKVTATAQGPNGEKATANMELTYDSSKFTFVSCSQDNYSGGSGGTVNTTASSFSVTLKATASGTASVKVSGSNGVISESQEALGSMVAAGAKVEVGGNSAEGGADNLTGENETDNSNKSADNSLSELSLSTGTLSPEFRYNVTEYTATVPGDVSSIEVNAKPSNAKAKVESITGADSLKEGTNTITVTVAAENGAKASYKIVVTKEAGTTSPQEEPDAENTKPQDPGADTGGEATENGITLNGISYEVTGDFSDSEIPEGFAKADITYQGQTVSGAKYEKGELFLLYLTSEEENAKKGFYVYDAAQKLFQPLVRFPMGDKSVILLPKSADDTVPEGYAQKAVTVGETEGVTVFAFQGEPDLTKGEFYLFYGMDDAGQSKWYRYDTVEGTLQRYVESYAYSQTQQPYSNEGENSYLQEEYDKLDDKYNKEKSSSRIIIAVLIFVIVVLIIVCINVAVFKGGHNKEGGRRSLLGRREEFWDEEDYDDNYDDDEEETERRKDTKPGFFKRLASSKAIRDTEENDLLDLDEENDPEEVMIKETKSAPKSKSLNDAGNSGRTKAAGVTLDTGHASGVKGAAAASRMTGNTAAVRPAGMTGNLTGGRPAGGVGMGASTAGGVGATAPNTVTGGAGLSAHGAKTAAGVGATAHSPGKAGEVGVKSHKTDLTAGVGAAAKTKEDTKRFISPEELKESMPQFLQNAKKRTKQEESKDYDFEEHLPDDGQEEKGQDDDLEIIDLDDL